MLKGVVDTAGDEGAIFSALIRGQTPISNELNQNDHHIIRIDGVNTAVEASSPEPILVKDIRAGSMGQDKKNAHITPNAIPNAYPII